MPGRRLRGLTVLHPFPSALNALLVLALALLAGGSLTGAGGLALAMLALQFSIGAANDVFDEDFDTRSKPLKPLPSGLLRRRTAIVVAVACGGLALGVAALYGPVVLSMAGLMLGAGLVYDAWLKRGPWAWAAFSVAFPVLPLYAWYGASGELPPRPELLLPIAALAGPALQLSNGLVDLERDEAAGLDTLAGRLGHNRSVVVVGALLAVIHGLAWSTLVGGGEVVAAAPVATAFVVAAGVLAVAGLTLSARRNTDKRERGWQAQAASIAVLALGWLAGALPGPAP